MGTRWGLCHGSPGMLAPPARLCGHGAVLPVLDLQGRGSEGGGSAMGTWWSRTGEVVARVVAVPWGRGGWGGGIATGTLCSRVGMWPWLSCGDVVAQGGGSATRTLWSWVGTWLWLCCGDVVVAQGGEVGWGGGRAMGTRWLGVVAVVWGCDAPGLCPPDRHAAGRDRDVPCPLSPVPCPSALDTCPATSRGAPLGSLHGHPIPVRVPVPVPTQSPVPTCGSAVPEGDSRRRGLAEAYF